MRSTHTRPWIWLGGVVIAHLAMDGTRNLLQAAIGVHARRLIVGSFALLSGSDHPASMTEIVTWRA